MQDVVTDDDDDEKAEEYWVGWGEWDNWDMDWGWGVELQASWVFT